MKSLVKPPVPSTNPPSADSASEAPLGEALLDETPLDETPLGETPLNEAPMTQAPMTQTPMTQTPMTLTSEARLTVMAKDSPENLPEDLPRAEVLEPAHPAITKAETIPLTYDLAEIQATYQGQRGKSLKRWAEITRPLFAFFWGRWWDKKTGKAKQNESKRAIQLRETLTQLGPAFIKIGQALSTRPDILEGAYLEELSKLQDQLPPFDNAIAFRFIQEELGQSPQELFAEISDHPIAAASLGQVYRGRLHTGEDVAIKVQRPGLAQQIALDIYLLRGLAAWTQKKLKGQIKTDLVGILDEFAERLFEEMDYTKEGKNAEQFDHYYGHLNNIYVPTIYWTYTHTRVLTMEWISGTKLNYPDKIVAQGINATELIDSGIQCSLRQLLEHGFFHADPHPGNLLAMPNGKLAYLDFGMMSEINIAQRYSLTNAIVHIVNREFEALAQDYVDLGFLTSDTDLGPISLALSQVFNDALGASVAELNINSIFSQLSDIMYEYPFRVPAYYALIVRSLISMEGIAIGVDPKFKVLSAAYPYVAKRLLTDSSPELRQSLKDLLLKDGRFRWNRLENLLQNAQNIQDYDLGATLNQAMDFLFSDRGAFIRDRIAEELIKSLDQLGQSTLETMNPFKGAPQKLFAGSKEQPTEAQQNLEHLKRIWKLLQETPGFDAMQLLNAFAQVIGRPEAKHLGQQVASGLAQKAIARFVREWI